MEATEERDPKRNVKKHRLRGELLKNIFQVWSSYENSSKDLGERLVHV